MAFDFEKGMANPLTALGLSLVANTQNPGQAIQQGLQQGLAAKKAFDKEQAGKALSKAIMAGADPNEAISIYAEAGGDPMEAANYINAINKGRSENLPQGYRWNSQANQAELIPGVDPSYGRKADPYAMPMPVLMPDGTPGFAPKGAVVGGGYQPFSPTNPNIAPPVKPLPASALKLQQESLDAIGTAKSIEADLGNVISAIENKKIQLGPIDNIVSGARNWAGASTPESRNYGTFKATLEKMRNDSLRLNKGVQTEGDAQRAWNELMTNINDEALVKQRLQEIKNINARAATLHEYNIENIRNNYNQEPLDTSVYSQPAAILGGQQPGAIPPSSAQPANGIKFLGFE